jgi:hypothetical protein
MKAVPEPLMYVPDADAPSGMGRRFSLDNAAAPKPVSTHVFEESF